MIATEKTALLTVPKGERCTQGHMEKHLGARGGQQYVGKSLSCGFRGKEQARQGLPSLKDFRRFQGINAGLFLVVWYLPWVIRQGDAGWGRRGQVRA